MSVIFPLKKHMSAIFCLLHDTKWEQFEAFLARIVANLIKKFKTQCSTDRSPNYLGFYYDFLPLFCLRCDFETVFHKASTDLGMW
jgi:hypothetical protein